MAALAGGPIHLTLVDPDKSPGERGAEVARLASELGTHAILLGGSTGISREKMDETARAIRRTGDTPVIIFPEGPGSLSGEAQAILFMSLLNSRNLDLVVRAHARAAPVVRSMGLEAIPLGYLIVAPGMRVGEVGEADAVPRDRPEVAQGYALAAELLGMRFVYLEAGSGAPEPVPAAMVRAVRSVLTVPLIVGGGIRTGEDAQRLLGAGANALVTGTVVEDSGASALRAIVAEVHAARGR